MKPIDSGEYHLPEFDFLFRRNRRPEEFDAPSPPNNGHEGSDAAQPTVHVPLHHEGPPPCRAEDNSDLERIDQIVADVMAEARGLELKVALERARRLVGRSAALCVTLVVDDVDTFDRIKLPGEVEEYDRESHLWIKRCLQGPSSMITLVLCDDEAGKSESQPQLD